MEADVETIGWSRRRRRRARRVIFLTILVASFLGPNLLESMTRRSRMRERAGSDLEALLTALGQYRRSNGGARPSDLEALIQWYDEESPASEKRFHRLGNRTFPRDPWNNGYHCIPLTDGASVLLASFGADDEPGGWGANRDTVLVESPDGVQRATDARPFLK